MKKGESFQLNYAWWDKGRPGPLPSTGLGKALQNYEKSKASPVSALKALLEVDAARQKAIGMCSGPLYADTKAALQKADAISQAAKGHLEKLDAQIAKITTSTAKMKSYLNGVPKLVTKYEKATNPNEQKKLAKDIGVNAQYLADNVTRAGTASDGLNRYAATLKQYPGLWAKFTAAKKEFDQLTPDARRLISETRHFAGGS